MDRNGIEKAYLSVSAPGVYVGETDFAAELARACNEFLAGVRDGRPDRFGSFAVLPLPDVEAALAELEHAMDNLGLDGVGMLASIGNRYLGDEAFDPVFDELNRRRAVVFVHPDIPPGSDIPQTNIPPFLIEFLFDTTRAVTNLLFSGTLERCPDIRFILAHAGGTIPYVVLRLMLGEFLPGLKEHVPKGVRVYLERLYYETALSAAPHALRSLQELVDDSHILFGSDYPFAPELATQLMIANLDQYEGLDDVSLEAVYRENALSLLPG
jgi:predicted TIM-barrel fold metal-dependent hydrolase